MGVINGNNNQITINVHDIVPPGNLATIDKDGMLGNAISKEQFQDAFDEKTEEIDEKIKQIELQVESDFKGILSPSDAAPAEDGSYKPSVTSEDDKPTDPNSTIDWGKVYPNAGYLRAKTGYNTMFYKKGATWTKSETKMPQAENKINNWQAIPYSSGAQVFYSNNNTIYESNQSTLATDVPGVSSKWVKKVAGVIDIVETPFTYKLNFQKDYWFRYSKLFGTVSIKEDTGSIFGKMNFLKLTGGGLSFGSNFVAQAGSASYIPTKTNVITAWSEYGKVKYFIENYDLEPLTFGSKVISYYDFTNKGSNTELSAMTADFGSNLSGQVTYFKINSAGTMLTTKTAASTFTDAIFLNKGTLLNYKVTMFMAFGAHFTVSPNDATGSTYSDYIRFIKGTPNTTVRHTSPSGNTDTTTTLIPATASSGYIWEFEVRGNSIKIYVNTGLAYEGTTVQTGNFFAIAFTAVGDLINSIRLEEL